MVVEPPPLKLPTDVKPQSYFKLTGKLPSLSTEKDLNDFWVKMFPSNPTKPAYVTSEFLK